MILTLTQTQAWQVRKLLSQCCNRKDGNCLLLDNGDRHRCLQQEILYAVVCEHFAKAVLPANKELYKEIKTHNHLLEE